MPHSEWSVSFLRRLVAFLTLFACSVLSRLDAALPTSWASVDIGTASVAGSAGFDSGTGVYTVQGSGASDIAGTSDHFHFAYRPLSGDGFIVARIASLTNTNSWAKAGVMIRETLDGNSKHALMMVTPTSGTGIKYRTATGGSSTQVMVTGAAPRWLKLERRGKVVTGFESADGVTWNVVQRVALAMNTDVFVGLVACSKTSALTTITADQVVVDSPDASVALPWPWTEQTIGSPADAGAALYDGSYVLGNLGADISGTADKMKYVSQTLIGDGEITVKVSSVTSSDNSTRLGLMMRESLDANARNVVLGITTSKSVVFMSRRTIAGTLTSRATNVTVTVPAWLRLQRTGNVFTAWRSTDGVNWTEHGSETLDLGPVLNVGLAYSNRHSSTWAIGVGDDLKLTTPADTDGNGLDDAWEVQYFGGIGVDPLGDPDGDGLTNNQEWELGNDPQVFNLEGQRPLLELIGGNNQVAPTGTLLAQPLIVRVKDSLSGDPLPNIPVFFHVGQGNGRLGASAPGASSLHLMSDINGYAQSPFLLPTTAGVNLVNVSVGGRQQAGVTTFNLKALAGVEPLLFDIVDLGTPALPGQISYEDGTFTMTGATVSDNAGTSDRSTFAWRELTGDGYMVARVQFLQADSTLAQAGLMVRESLDANSPNIAILLTSASGVAFQARDTVGGNTAVNRLAGISGPVWLLLRRTGDVFTVFYSTDAVNWTYRSTRTLALGSTVKIGLTHATRTSVNNSAAFDNVRMGPLDSAPWSVTDIGLPRAAAIDDFNADSIYVRAGGTDMTGTADNFHYIYQPLVGDGRLIARVASHLAFNSATKSALMVRENLDAGSRHVSLTFASPSGITLRKREAANGTTTSANGVPTATAPYWLRVDRLGSKIVTYASADGATWTSTGTVAFDPGETPLIGLAAASNNTSQHSQALFDNIRLEMAEGSRGWNGAYYADADFKSSRAFRRDLDLDFSWPADVAPISGITAGSAYSVRWQGDVVPAHSETYTFTTLSQGAARVLVNGQTVIDRLTPHTLATTTGTIALVAGQPVRVVVEYINTVGIDARIRLNWSSASQPDSTVSFTDVLAIDSDDDGMPDAWELAHGLNPHNAADALLDADSDGLTNLQEFQLGGNPQARDDRLSGVVLQETWTNLAGTTVRELTKHAKFHAAPNSVGTLFALDVPQNSANSYGRRVRGYIVPPVTGEYRFHVAANDAAEFWLSPDDSPFTRVKVARVAQGTPAYHQFDAHPEQRSAPVLLEAGQFYFFELLHKEGSSDDHLTVAWTRPGFTTPEVISGSALALYAGRSDDLDNNGLPDAWETSHGLVALADDADNDRLPNLLEYQHGLNPLVADTDADGYEDFLEVVVQTDPLAASDLNLTPWQLGDVGPVSTTAIAKRVDTDAFLVAGTGSGMAMHKEDNFRFLHRAVTGDFELTARIARPDGHAIGLAGVSVRSGLSSKAVNLTLLQSVLGQNSPFVRTTEGGAIVPLPAFTPAFANEDAAFSGYWFRARREGALVSLYYSADGQRWILSNAKTLALAESCLVGFAICHNMGPFTSLPDIDVPVRLIKDVSLVTGFTPPASPETVPPDATVTPVTTINGNAGAPVNGQWATDADGIVSKTFTGKLDYTFTVPVDGLYRLTFTAHSGSNPTASTLFPLEISVDGQFVARVDLVLPLGEDGLARVITPWLAAGTHTVRLHYDNTFSYRPLRIRSLAVDQLGGADLDANGRADWIDARLHALNTLVTGADDGELYVSPASLSGLARHRSLFTLTADAQPVVVNPAPGYGWYADVALSETAPVEVVGDFENSGRVQGALLTWKPINLLALSSEDFPQPVIRIRKGDRLRLTAHPFAATDGGAVVTIARTGANNVELTLADAVAASATHTFAEAGTYTVNATYTDGATTPIAADAFTVEVIEAAFASDPTVGLNNTPVTWDNPLIFDNVLLEVDHGLLLVKQADLPSGGTRFSVTSSNANESYIIARLGENGPVFGHATVRSIRVATVSDTAMDLLQVYPDGSQLIGVPIIVNNLTDDTRIVVEIFVQGVTFEDGTIVKVLTKSDFDQYGRIYLKFIYPPGVDGSICHRVLLYEGDTYLGKF